MAQYVKTVWLVGDIITAVKLNNNEDWTENANNEKAPTPLTLTHGLQNVSVAQASKARFTINGRTLVNILGKRWNGESLTGLTIAGAVALSTTQKKSGTQSIKITDASNVYEDLTYPLDTTKSYVVAGWVYVESHTSGNKNLLLCDVGTGNIRYSVTSNNATIGSWQFVYVKVPTSNTLVGTGFRLYAESTGTAVTYFDDIRIYEVSSTLYTAIGTTYTASTNPSIDDILPYVDSVKNVNDPVILHTGKNLYDIDKVTLHANATRTADNVITLTSNASYNDNIFIFPALPNTQYYLNVTASAGIGIYSLDEAEVGLTTHLNKDNSTVFSGQAFTTHANAKKIKINFFNPTATAGTYTFTNPILELGSSFTFFEPYNPSYALPTVELCSDVLNTVNDRLYEQDGQYWKLKRWQKLQLDGSLTWAFYSDFSGFKGIKVAISGFVANVGTVVKYNGYPLITAPNSTSWETQADKILMHTDGYLYILISDGDSGWGETFTPDAAEMDAMVNGWKLNNGTFGTNYNGTGTKTWIPWGAVDNSAAVTVVPTTVSTAISGGTYDYYRLQYQLALSTVEPVTCEGGYLPLQSGGNHTEVLEGGVVREEVVPYLSSGTYYINAVNSASYTDFKASRILKIDRDDGLGAPWTLLTNGTLNGTGNATLASTFIDLTKKYYATYLKQDKYLYTSNIVDITAEYWANVGSVVAQNVRDLADVVRDVSVVESKIQVLNDTIEVAITWNGDFSTNAIPNVTKLFPWSAPAKLSAPGTLPASSAYGADWSPNGEFLVIAHDITPFVTIYQRSGTTFTKLANPATLPAGNGNFAAWSPNGEFLAVGHGTTPFITIYQRSGSTFTKLADPATLPAGTVDGVAWSPNGEFLAAAHSTTPFLTIYQRSGTTFTKLADPATLPAGQGLEADWSPNGEFLVIAHDITPFVTIYQRSGTTFTKLANPGTLPTGTGLGCSWSPNGEFLVISHAITPFITIYQRSGTTFTKLANPSTLPAYTLQASCWSPNGEFLATITSSSPKLMIYQRSGATFTKLADPASNIGTTNGAIVAWSPNGEFLLAGGTNTPYIDIYQTASSMPDSGILVIKGDRRQGT